MTVTDTARTETARTDAGRTDRAGADVLADRYTVSDAVDGWTQLLQAHDEVLDRDVTLLLLPSTGGVGDRVALRLQLRQLSSTQHPHLAHAFDVVDAPDRLGVVLRLLPGAQLLSALPAQALTHGVLEQVGEALRFLHDAGRAHGSVTADAVAVLPGGDAVLLPVPARPGAVPADDLRALTALAGVLRSTPAPAIATAPATAALDAPTTVISLPPAGPDHPAAVRADLPPSQPDQPPVVPALASASRVAFVLVGGFGGALLADLASRLLG